MSLASLLLILILPSLTVYPDSVLDLASLLEAKSIPLFLVEDIVLPSSKITFSLSIRISLNPSPLVVPTEILSLLTSALTLRVPLSKVVLYQ